MADEVRDAMIRSHAEKILRESPLAEPQKELWLKLFADEGNDLVLFFLALFGDTKSTEDLKEATDFLMNLRTLEEKGAPAEEIKKLKTDYIQKMSAKDAKKQFPY